ncbi:MAG: carboxypeptidase-like regulatory domain-containing protein [Myxococcota bacterium]|jgi:hypothetical protein|nr:carboxypeptidase-like regulatory domain-containing protein [Myxococcota bacterium]
MRARFVLSLLALGLFACTDHVPADPLPDVTDEQETIDGSDEAESSELAETADEQADVECSLEKPCTGCAICVNGSCQPVLGSCATDLDCPEDAVCAPNIPGLPECGGRCEMQASYVAHEWGVNLVSPEGSAHVGATPQRYYGAIPAKPVIYFYTGQALELDVGVQFASGSSSETWPPLENAASLQWNGIALSPGPCTLSPTPQPDWDGIESKEIYELPHWIVDEAACLQHAQTTSKLLFYTGNLEEYEAPLRLRASVLESEEGAQVVFDLRNEGSFDLGPIMLLYRDPTSTCVDPSLCVVHELRIAWTKVEKLEAGSSKIVELPLLHLKTEGSGDFPEPVELPEAWAAQADTLATWLRNESLYTSEIEVFAEAWTELFFGIHGNDAVYRLPGYRNGAFALWMWPPSWEQTQLSLSFSPQPSELSRAIVEYQEAPLVPASSGRLGGRVARLDDDVLTPAAGAVVAAFQGEQLVAEAIADQEGRYGLSLEPGSYTVTASRYGNESTVRVEDVQLVAGRLERLDFELSCCQ